MEQTVYTNGSYQETTPRTVGNLIVAGDGYAYVAYSYMQTVTSAYTSGLSGYGSTNTAVYLDVLRVGLT
jgi:hypothetical protein